MDEVSCSSLILTTPKRLLRTDRRIEIFTKVERTDSR